MPFIYDQAPTRRIRVLWTHACVSGVHVYIAQPDVRENSHDTQNVTSDFPGELWSQMEEAHYFRTVHVKAGAWGWVYIFPLT